MWGLVAPRTPCIFVHSMSVNEYGKTRLWRCHKTLRLKFLTKTERVTFFVEDTTIFRFAGGKKTCTTFLISTDFCKKRTGEHVKIVPQFKIGEYIRAEYARQIPKYRVDFLMTYSKGGKERTLILEYDGVEYHTKNPDIVTKHNFSQEYLDYDISRQIELESYGYRFLRLNKFNLRPEQVSETKTDVLNRLLRKAFAVE